MWPWTHFAVGYVAVSVIARARDRRVDDAAFVAVLAGSQFPDLVDKPLAWRFDLLPSGTSLAHSVFVAVPTCLLAWFVARRCGHGPLAFAFAVGYLFHLPGDIVYRTITSGGPPAAGALLWPLVSQPAGGEPAGLLEETLYYVRRYSVFLSRPSALRYVLFEVSLLSTTLWLWLRDGRPGLGLVTGCLKRLRSRG